MLIFHLLEFFFKIRDGLLTVVFVIIFFRQVSHDFLIDFIFLKLFLSDLIDLIHGLLNGVLIVLVESQQILNVLIFGIVPQRDTLLNSVLHELLHVLRFFVG